MPTSVVTKTLEIKIGNNYNKNSVNVNLWKWRAEYSGMDGGQELVSNAKNVLVLDFGSDHQSVDLVIIHYTTYL